MSLIDSLLLEPPKSEREIWIALRSDGVKGSGTQSDPYDGSTIYGAPVPISSLSCAGLIATAVTTGPHNLSEGEVFRISGAGVNGDWWDGAFTVSKWLSSTTFEFELRRAPKEDPPTGRVLQKPLSYRFDEVMRSLPGNTAIHLAPGVFETRGERQRQSTDPIVGWEPQNGFRMLGAGMGLTTVKLVGATMRNLPYAPIYASQYLAGFELSDLMIDCNLEDQPSPHVSCGAVNICAGGRHIRVRRVRAINFGSRGPDYYRENFVFFLCARVAPPGSDPAAYETFDCTFEECVAEQPSPNIHWNSSIFLVGGNVEDGTSATRKASNRACVIRNCYVDGRNDNGPVVQIQSVAYGSGVVTVTTKRPHGHRRPGNLIVQGVAENAYNGIFEIDDIIDETTLKYKVTLSSSPGPSSGGTIGGRVSSNSVAIESLQVVPDSQNKRFTLTTKEPHFRTTNNSITLMGVSGTGSAPFRNKTYPIVGYDPTQPNALTFELPAAAPSPLALEVRGGFAKVGHGALTADNGILEGNRVFHCNSAGPFHDTFSMRDTVARDNYFSGVHMGFPVALNGVSAWWSAIALQSLEYDDAELVCPTLALHSFAEVDNSLMIARMPETSEPACHGLLPNDKVTIVVPDGSDDQSIYQGTFTVVETPDARTFTYEGNGTATRIANLPQFRPAIPASFNPDILWQLRPLKQMAKRQQTGKWVITVTVALVSGSRDHGLEKGEIVKIGNVGRCGQSPLRSTVLNGNFKLTAADPATGTFEFELDSEPPDDLGHADFSPGYYGRIWRVDYLLFESNVVELAIHPLWSNWNARSAGVHIAVGGHPPQYVVRQAIIRDNLFRHVNNRSYPASGPTDPSLPRAIQFWTTALHGVEDALVQKNIIRLDGVLNVLMPPQRPTPIEFQRNVDVQRGIQTFNNVSPEGILVPAITEPQDPYETRPELVSIIRDNLEDLLTTAFLK